MKIAVMPGDGIGIEVTRQAVKVLRAVLGNRAGLELRYSFNDAAGEERIRRAVRSVLAQGLRTADLVAPGVKSIGTEAMGDAVVGALGEKY